MEPLSQRAETSRETQHLIVQHGGPAFVRRGRKAQAAWDQLLASLPAKRDEMLEMVRLRVGILVARAGSVDTLSQWLDANRVKQVRTIHAETSPRLRVPIEPTTSARVIQVAYQELCTSIERFNRRWRELVEGLPLDEVNRARDEYNRHYVMEKEFATGSMAIARRHFEPLLPATADDVLAAFPLLPER